MQKVDPNIGKIFKIRSKNVAGNVSLFEWIDGRGYSWSRNAINDSDMLDVTFLVLGKANEVLHLPTDVYDGIYKPYFICDCCYAVITNKSSKIFSFGNSCINKKDFERTFVMLE